MNLFVSQFLQLAAFSVFGMNKTEWESSASKWATQILFQKFREDRKGPRDQVYYV